MGWAEQARNLVLLVSVFRSIVKIKFPVRGKN